MAINEKKFRPVRVVTPWDTPANRVEDVVSENLNDEIRRLGKALAELDAVSDDLTVPGDLTVSGGVSGSSCHFGTASGLTVNVSGQWAFDGHAASTPETYTETNGTEDRAFDANALTLDELADIVATLIADLRSKGVVR